MTEKKIHIWKPLAAVSVWGFSFIATKHLLAEISPLVIILLRQIIACVFLTVIALKTKQNFRFRLRDFGGIVILSIISTLHLGIQVTGLQYTTAANTGWIIGFSPIFMTLMGLLLFKEKISMVQLAGIVIAFFGLLLLVGKGDLTSISIMSQKGDFLILASSFTWSVYSNVGKKITLNYPPMMTILYLFMMMSIIIAPFTINASNINAVMNLPFGSWLAVFFLGILCSGVAYVLWAQALTEMSSTKVGAFLYVEPFITFFAAWAMLGEHVTVVTLLSGLVIIAGVILVNRK